jgi:hypothetical protein
MLRLSVAALVLKPSRLVTACRGLFNRNRATANVARCLIGTGTLWSYHVGPIIVWGKYTAASEAWNRKAGKFEGGRPMLVIGHHTR